MGGAVTHRLHPARLGRCYDSFPEVHGIAKGEWRSGPLPSHDGHYQGVRPAT
jgi:hypothetical protein